MHFVGAVLGGFSRHGPPLLLASLVVGCLVPILASQAERLLPLAAFLLTLGSFLTAGFTKHETETGPLGLVLALVWVGLGVPVSIAGLLFVVGPSEALRTGILVSVLAPPIGGAAAIAVMLGLRARLALVASIGLTLLTPVVVPLLADLLALGVPMAPWSLGLHLAAIVGPAGLLALVALRLRLRLQAVLPGVEAASGVAVIGLALVGFAMADDLRAYWTRAPDEVLAGLAIAFGLNLGIGLVSVLLLRPLGLPYALTTGFVAANRNVSLTWAAAGSALSPSVETYLATTVVPVLALPFAIRAVLALRRLVSGDAPVPPRGTDPAA